MSRLQVSGRDPATGRCILLSIENGRIASIEPSDEPCEFFISAGLVDLQVNGYLGLDLNAQKLHPETVSKLTRALLRTGVTTFAPTVITAPEEEIVQRLAAIAEAREHDAIAAGCIPYIHVEGPHISPLDGFRGAHALESVRPPSIEEFNRWQAACGDLVGMVTLSPHYPEAPAYIATLVEREVHVSLGHTHASHAEIEAAVHAGARLSTHLGNAIAPLLPRHPNPIWSQLAEDRLTASFISDGHHLPAETLKAMVRAKGCERSILVSDAVALAGMPPGEYVAPVGGPVVLSADGRLAMRGALTLAGAVLPLIDCISCAVRMTGQPLSSVLAMATQNPGRFAANRGRLAVGERADVLQFYWNEEKQEAIVKDVWLAGQRMYEAP